MKAPKHVHGYIDRHGKARFYLRRKGCARVALPGLPWSPEFMAAYQDAMTSEASKPAPSARHIKPGTVASLVHSYLHSVAFGELALETKRTRKNILRRFGNEHGDKRAAMLKRDHIVAMFTKMSGKRFAARNWLKTVRALMQFAIGDGSLKEDPTAGIKNMSGKTEGFRTWNEDDIAAFEARHLIGTRERLALALLLCTAQRRSDVVRMGRQHIRNGILHVRQAKTGAVLDIPVHPDLQAIIDATSGEHLTFLTSSKTGGPYVGNALSQQFRIWCDAAELPHCSAHGLRKAACRRCRARSNGSIRRH